MAIDSAKRPRGRPKSKDGPLGRRKIIQALEELLAQKGFQDITWAEIARRAGVSEALIYQHFKSRRGLLYYVLAEYLTQYLALLWERLQQTQGALEKIEAFIHGLLSVYNDNRVFARILLLEVRSFQDYFDSQAYTQVQTFGSWILQAIEDGAASGEIRGDLPPIRIRQALLGAIEHAILPYVIFHKEADIKLLTEELTLLLVDAIKTRP